MTKKRWLAVVILLLIVGSVFSSVGCQPVEENLVQEIPEVVASSEVTGESPTPQEEEKPTAEPGEVEGTGEMPVEEMVPVKPAQTSGEQEKTSAQNTGPEPSVVEITEEDHAASQQVYLTIIGLEGETVLSRTSSDHEEGLSVFDLLSRVTRENRIQMDSRGGGKSVYVEGIANLYEFDHGPMSGWLYSVNGDYPSKSSGAFVLEQGDEVIWRYSKEGRQP